THLGVSVMPRERFQVLIEGRRSQGEPNEAGGTIVRAGQGCVSQRRSSAVVLHQRTDNFATGLGRATEALEAPQILEAIRRDPVVETRDEVRQLELCRPTHLWNPVVQASDQESKIEGARNELNPRYGCFPYIPDARGGEDKGQRRPSRSSL